MGNNAHKDIYKLHTQHKQGIMHVCTGNEKAINRKQKRYYRICLLFTCTVTKQVILMGHGATAVIQNKRKDLPLVVVET